MSHEGTLVAGHSSTVPKVTTLARPLFRRGSCCSGLEFSADEVALLASWETPTSPLCHKQTSEHVRNMSALPPKADIQEFATCIRLNPDYDTAVAGCIMPPGFRRNRVS